MSLGQDAAGIERVEISQDGKLATLHFRPAAGADAPAPITLPISDMPKAALRMLHAAGEARPKLSKVADTKQIFPTGRWWVSGKENRSEFVFTLEVKGTKAAIAFALSRAQVERFADALDAGLGRLKISSGAAPKH